MLHKGSIAAFVGILSLGVAGKVGAQDKFSYAGCADITQADFNQVLILDNTKDASLDEVTRFSVAYDGSVYYSERGGTLKVLKTTGTVVKLGKVNSYPTTSPLKKQLNNVNNEFGLVGMQLDPNFETNHFIYVDYQMATEDSSRLARFTVSNDVLDMTSEKVILEWPTQKDYCCHTGGDIRIDNKGDLWISVGNNTLNAASDGTDSSYVDGSFPNSVADDQGHAANSNDLRGKILRIHPTADGSYTIPAGNLKDYYASMYTASELAKIRPEIYTMGHRNPYTISVDNQNGLLTWGDVGPDNGYATEEYNLVSHPGFMGWPYFAGTATNPNYIYRMKKDPAAPLNTSSNNTGVQMLPPAQGAIYGYNQSAAVTGPIYRFSNAQTSAKKLPVQLDGKWFVTDWKQGGAISAFTLDATYTKILTKSRFFTPAGGGFVHPLQISMGPDGVMYVLHYNNLYNFTTVGNNHGVMDVPFWKGLTTPPKIFRLEYKGAACVAATSIHRDTGDERSLPKNVLLTLGMDGNRIVNVPIGSNGFRLYDISGKLVWEKKLAEVNLLSKQMISVPSSSGNGLFKVQFLF